MIEETENYKEKTIYIALAMSGAISAGAYSAGVLDFLVEALEEWEKAKRKDKETGQKTVPHHRVVIAGMSGASAGAITSSIGAIAAGMGARLPKGDKVAQRDMRAAAGDIPWHVLPELYTAWVDGPFFVKEDGASGTSLLDIDDLQDAGSLEAVTSLLNAAPLRDIGSKAMNSLQQAAGDRKEAPAWLPTKLHVFLTQTNTRGIPYKIQVMGGQGSSIYGMMNHLDHAHFALHNLGAADFKSDWSDADACREYDASGRMPGVSSIPSLWEENGKSKPNCDILVKNTLASGAFPVGLSAIDLDNPLAFYERKAWPLDLPLDRQAFIKPEWPWNGGYQAPESYRFAALDGGAINNDPFDLARFLLMENPPEPLPTDVAEVDRIVVMISPFPEAPQISALGPNGKPSTALGPVAAGLVNMLVQQSRFRPDILMRAVDNKGGDLWRISPSRFDETGQRQNAAIACGLWGGFGGFLDVEFRRHDYELGRRNCQAFLKNWFGLPAKNQAIDAFGNPLPNLQPTDEAGEEVRYPIIPLCGTAGIEATTRPWPVVSVDRYKKFHAAVMKRYDRIVDIGWDSTLNSLSWAKRNFARADPGFIFAKKALRTNIDALVQSSTFEDLVRRDQILTESQRKVLECCMADAPSAYIVAQRIAKNVDLGAVKIAEVYGIIKSLLNLPSEIVVQNICQRLPKFNCKDSKDTLESVVRNALATPAPVYRTVDSIFRELQVTGPLSTAGNQTMDAGSVQQVVSELVQYGYLAEADWTAEDPKRKVSSLNFWAKRVKGYRYVGRADGKTCD